MIGLLVVGGVAIAAEQANESVDLAMVSVVMEMCETVALDSGGRVTPAGREAVYACEVLKLTPWPVIGVAALVVWGVGAAIAGTAARSMILPLALAVGVGAAYALEVACADSLL